MFQPDYEAQAEACNLARNYDDVDDSWDSVKSIIEFYGDDDGNFSSVARPGYFNDPDMVRPVPVFPQFSDDLFPSHHPQFSDHIFGPFSRSFLV